MPGLHDEQVCAPLELLCFPAAHATHALAFDMAASGFALPAPHGTGSDAVDGQYEPARHKVQLVALPKLYVPGLHDEQFCAPDEPL